MSSVRPLTLTLTLCQDSLPLSHPMQLLLPLHVLLCTIKEDFSAKKAGLGNPIINFFGEIVAFK